MKVEEGLDTGPVYGRLVVPIGPEEDLPTLRDELVTAGCALLVAAWPTGRRDSRCPSHSPASPPSRPR